MNRVDPRLKKLGESLQKINNETETKSKQITSKTILKLWPKATIEKIEDNCLFYEQQVAKIPRLTLAQFSKSLKRKNVPQEIIKNISLIDVDYRGYNNKIYHGQIIIHKDLVSSISEIFKRILTETDFPITSLIPLSMFDWNDLTSIRYNNSGAFNWRKVADSDEISDHAMGCAIDVNPLQNPWKRKGFISHKHDVHRKGSLHSHSPVVKIFKENGWKWGGDWKKSKDWQHFYRPEISYKYFGKEEVIE